MTRVPFMAWTFWMPALLTAVGGGVLGSIFLVFAFGNWGVSVWFGAPFAVGAILGYRVRAAPMLLVLLSLVGAAGFITGMVSLQLAGAFCAMALGIIILAPVLLGLLAGWLLRRNLKESRFSQRSWLPVLLIFAALMGLGLVERLTDSPNRIESVTTEGVIAAPIEASWDGLVFYEEVTHPAPWILRIGLARPLSASGSGRRAGDIKKCVYNKGHISKRITAVNAPRLLAFDVIEQQIGYERDVRLVDGSFEFVPIGDGLTQVRLTTRYVPRLSPRWCWRPFEEIAVHTLHDYVIEGIRLRAECPRPAVIALRASD